jgi:hypothetical protein
MATLSHPWRANLTVTGLTVRDDAPPDFAPRVTVHAPLTGPQTVTALPGLDRTGTLTVWCPDRAARDAVLRLAYFGDPLYLGDACDPDLLDEGWIAVTRATVDRVRADRPGLWLSLEYTRVGEPGGAMPEPWTYADLEASAADYATALAPFGNYDALWYGPLPADAAPPMWQA